jgi:lipoate-protein ligase A
MCLSKAAGRKRPAAGNRQQAARDDGGLKPAVFVFVLLLADAVIIYQKWIEARMKTWRLLDSPPMAAARNMAIDKVILHARAQDRVPNTLRFMQVRPRAVLVGFHQMVEQEVREDYCGRNGIQINRRITGGGALFFDESQIGWEIFASRDTPGIPRKVEDLYRKMCEGTVLGLEKLGITAHFRPKNDIEVGHRKISGTGGTFDGTAFLFQGTLLVDFDAPTMLRALRIPIEKLKDKEVSAVKRRVTWIGDELGHVPPARIIKNALVDGFSRSLGTRFSPAPLSSYERRLLSNALPTFLSSRWVFGARRPPQTRQVLKSSKKTRGGLIRVSMVADPPAKRINYAIITGDFFAFPKNTIMDLEARLKDIPLDGSSIRDAVLRYFREEKPEIPFTGPLDFIQVLQEAAQKTGWVKHGIPREDVNSVFFIIKPVEELSGCGYLLLPYCAKPLDCSWRKKDGCNECGRCATGEMYALARKKGLRPITITSYQHLQRVLRELKKNGAGGFIGSCCEPFYIKHRQDLERLGVPGVLVDIDSRTCYDLYKDAEAHAGKFDRQTELKEELLKKVVRSFGARKRPGRSREPRL